MMRHLLLGISVLGMCGVGLAHLQADDRLVLVENGTSLMPIVIFEGAPPFTRRAADELAFYIEKTSGARPEVIEGLPDPLPESAIWVGVQPVLTELFPDLNFDFEHPEEILIAANANHLVIAGRDVWEEDILEAEVGRRGLTGVQQEYGTHNAVYSFLHDHLGVRWLWPGELGLDILKQDTIAFEPFVERYHPQVRARGGLLGYSVLERAGPGGPEEWQEDTGNRLIDNAFTGYWLRAQRLQLSELPSPGGHGLFPNWWERYHKTHPHLFALQPDGSRGGGESPYPSAGNIKFCHSNAEVAEKWLEEVAAELEANPNQRVFNASPNDGWLSGHCVCEDCLAWDHPDGELRNFSWQGVSQQYVALSDRDVRFANECARLLRERYPDQDYYVYMLSYGHSRPPPIGVVPDDNVIIGNVANFLLRSDIVDRGSIVQGRTHRQNFADWGQLTRLQFWRPNTGSPVGFQRGMPDVPLRRTMDDMRFAGESGWMGIYIDYVREHWSTQGPLYYLMAQLIWNPYADGEAILEDYYQRAFGPAAKQMDAYWTYMEMLREECYGTEQPGRADHDIAEFYTRDRWDHALALLDKAREALGPEDDLYRQRIDFVEVGPRYWILRKEIDALMERVGQGEDGDGTLRAQAIANWEEIWEMRKAHPHAFLWRYVFDGSRGDGPPRNCTSGFDPRKL